MAERIDTPPIQQGDEKAQLDALWRYLTQLAEAINNNLDAIGGNELTDAERVNISQILQAAGVENTEQAASQPMETLKSLIIKTAEFVQTGIQEYRTTLFGESVANSAFGNTSTHKGLDVVVNPDGVMQNYSLRTIVQDLKRYEVNAKNYIKCGLLRTVDSIPVYGVAIGKDVVTMDENGVETYNDGNKVAELTADELSFYQNGTKVAAYTGNKISFFYNGTEMFYIQNGEIYAVGDLNIGAGKKVKVGDWTFYNGGLSYKHEDEDIGFQLGHMAARNAGNAGVFYRYYESSDESHATYGQLRIDAALFENNVAKHGIFYVNVVKLQDNSYRKDFSPYGSIDGQDAIPAWLGTFGRKWAGAYIDHVIGKADEATLADEAKGVKASYDSTVTNFNSLTETGRWWVSLSAMSNRPSDYTSGIGIVDVIKIASTSARQILYGSNVMYIRDLSSGTWGSWYKFAGTAV